MNEHGIKASDDLLRVLAGTELDSGPLVKSDSPQALAKDSYGLRIDFRDCGEFGEQPFKLHVCTGSSPVEGSCSKVLKAFVRNRSGGMAGERLNNPLIFGL